MNAPGLETKNLGRHSGKPLQKIDGVDSLIDQCTAAIQRKSALPTAVVLSSSIPFHICAREHETPKATFGKRRLHRDCPGTKSRLKNRRHLHPSFSCSVEQLIGALEVNLDRF